MNGTVPTILPSSDDARYRPSVFFLSSPSQAAEGEAVHDSVLSCPVRTMSRLYRIKASRLFLRRGSSHYEEALTYAVRAYRLDCQGATEEVLKDAPSKLPGGWREDESPVYQPVPDQSRSGASTTSSVVMIRGGGIGGNGPREDLFDQMACLRAGWPARALVMAMYMALGKDFHTTTRSHSADRIRMHHIHCTPSSISVFLSIAVLLSTSIFLPIYAYTYLPICRGQCGSHQESTCASPVMC